MWHGLTFLVFTLLGSSVLDAAQAINSCEPTPLYETCEIKITIDEAAIKQHTNPYMDIQLRGEFRSPKGGRTLVMPAFWDGGKQFVIRFAISGIFASSCNDRPMINLLCQIFFTGKSLVATLKLSKIRLMKICLFLPLSAVS